MAAARTNAEVRIQTGILSRAGQRLVILPRHVLQRSGVAKALAEAQIDHEYAIRGFAHAAHAEIFRLHVSVHKVIFVKRLNALELRNKRQRGESEY